MLFFTKEELPCFEGKWYVWLTLPVTKEGLHIQVSHFTLLTRVQCLHFQSLTFVLHCVDNSILTNLHYTIELFMFLIVFYWKFSLCKNRVVYLTPWFTFLQMFKILKLAPFLWFWDLNYFNITIAKLDQMFKFKIYRTKPPKSIHNCN